MHTPGDITDILRIATERGASDVILTAGLTPQFKVHGTYMGFDFGPLEPTDTRKLMYSMMNEKQQRTFEEKRELDFSFALGEKARFRVNAFMQKGAVGGVMRLIPTNIKSVEDLGLPRTVVEIADAPRGLVLVTGPTGSGKSTTLAAMIDYINSTKKMHIVTIEDPIEFMHTHKSSIVNQREVGADTWDFNNALRAVLRQAPDVILVGEMRDYETIKAAVTAAETGHLVMGTLHTNSAPESIDRIVDVFPEEQQAQIRVQLANNLVAVMTQQLIPRSDKEGRILAYELLIANPGGARPDPRGQDVPDHERDADGRGAGHGHDGRLPGGSVPPPHDQLRHGVRAGGGRQGVRPSGAGGCGDDGRRTARGGPDRRDAADPVRSPLTPFWGGAGPRKKTLKITSASSSSLRKRGEDTRRANVPPFPRLGEERPGFAGRRPVVFARHAFVGRGLGAAREQARKEFHDRTW
jgi:twitching motility protein PilT